MVSTVILVVLRASIILLSIVPFSGVVRVGAVNCAEDNWLCQRQGIRGLIGLEINSISNT